MVSRRQVLVWAGLAAGAAVTPAWAAEDRHVVYGRFSRREEAQEVLWDISRVLGPEVGGKLGLGTVGSDVVIWYDRRGSDPARAAKIARHHASLLARVETTADLQVTDLDGARLQGLFNLCYGVDPSLPEARRRYDQVGRMLGPDLLRDLVIQDTPDGFATIYQRYKDRLSGAKVARRHQELLSSKGVQVTVRVARQHPVVLRSTSRGVSETAIVHANALPAPTRKPAAPKATDQLRLPAAMSSDLRDAINDHIQGLRRKGVLQQERTAWYVYNLQDDEPLAAINAGTPLQAASMIKPFVALAVLDKARRGQLVYGPVTKAKMEAMIQVSSNEATNWCMKQLGGPSRVAALLRERYPALTRNLRLVEYIPSNGRTYRNLASATDYVAFLRAMWRDELPGSDEMRRLMNLPKRDRLYDQVAQVPGGTEVYNKTGSTARLCGDMGVLVARTRHGERFPYIVVGIIDAPRRASSYGRWISSTGRVIRDVSGLVYEKLRSEYGLV